MVRRLPVIQSGDEGEATLHRPPWRWALLGGGLAVTLWAALSSVLIPVAARLLRPVAVPPSDSAAAFALAAPVLLAFALAVGVSAFLVARFAPSGGPRLGAAVGAAATAIAWAVSTTLGLPQSPWVAVASLVALGLVGVLSGALAGRLGPPAIR